MKKVISRNNNENPEIFAKLFPNVIADKGLGQHFLFEQEILRQICAPAQLSRNDTVLEIGPGLGSLTAEILRETDFLAPVFAVEYDEAFAKSLFTNIAKIFATFNPGLISGSKTDLLKNPHVFHEDFLKFDQGQLPRNYKIVANIPYNITSPIIEKILTAKNPPQIAVLLVQKEVAKRIVAGPGDLSMLAIRTQVFAKCELGIEVSRSYFTPPPEVDSQVLILKPYAKNLLAEFSRKNNLNEELFAKTFWRVVSAGFANKRKKLRSSLAGGLNVAKLKIEETLYSINLDPNLRAQDLSIEQWLDLAKSVKM